MALINSNEYAGLGSYSNQGGRRGPGKFHNIYITGQKRAGEEIGKMQVVKEYGRDGNATHILQNQEKIKIIIEFMKQIRIMKKTIKQQDKVVCMSYNSAEGSVSSSGRKCPNSKERKNGWCDDCKFEWIISGLLLDSKNAPVKIKNDDTGAEESVHIYTRNGGIKFGSVIDFQNALDEKVKDLPPLSDNEEMERNVINPRRFVVEMSVTWKDTDHGQKAVFVYNPTTKLKDDTVQKILDECNKLTPDFDSQFDTSKYISSPSTGTTTSPEGVKTFDEVGNKEERKDEPKKENKQPEVTSDQLSDEIDLGF